MLPTDRARRIAIARWQLIFEARKEGGEVSHDLRVF